MDEHVATRFEWLAYSKKAINKKLSELDVFSAFLDCSCWYRTALSCIDGTVRYALRTTFGGVFSWMSPALWLSHLILSVSELHFVALEKREWSVQIKMTFFHDHRRSCNGSLVCFYPIVAFCLKSSACFGIEFSPTATRILETIAGTLNWGVMGCSRPRRKTDLPTVLKKKWSVLRLS